MTPFSPPHDAVLRPVMAHAERFCELLVARERELTTRDPDALWIMGRAGELRCLAIVLQEDLRSGRLSPGQAAIDLARHLQALHTGFTRVAGIHRPACCHELAELTPTVLLRDLSAGCRGDRS
jgi:hypothetical protein